MHRTNWGANLKFSSQRCCGYVLPPWLFERLSVKRVPEVHSCLPNNNRVCRQKSNRERADDCPDSSRYELPLEDGPMCWGQIDVIQLRIGRFLPRKEHEVASLQRRRALIASNLIRWSQTS